MDTSTGVGRGSAGRRPAASFGRTGNVWKTVANAALAGALLLVALPARGAGPIEATPQEDPQPASRILERVLEAHGGRAALEEFRGFRLRGRILAIAGGVNGTFRLSLSLDGAMRSEIRYASRWEVRILQGRLAWNGSHGRQQSASSEMADSMRLQYHRWAAPFELARVDPEGLILDGTSDEGWIRLRRRWKNDLETTYEVDPESWLIRRIRGLMDNSGHPLEFVAESADWREIDGVRFPFRVTTYIEGRIAAETILDRVVSEEDFPSATFRPDGPGGDL